MSNEQTTITMNDQQLVNELNARTNALRRNGNAQLPDVWELSRTYDAAKQDFVVDADSIRWNPENGKMTIPVTDEINQLFGQSPTAVELGYSDRAFRHVASKLGNLPAGYLLKCPNALRAENLNHWQREVKDGKQWRVRAFETAARAVVSDRYHAINNTDVIEIVNTVMTEMKTPYSLIRSYVDANTLHLKLRIADDSGGGYGIGVAIRNGEITNYKLGVFPFIQRHSCTNSIVYQSGGFEQMHVGHTEAFLRGAIAEHVGLALKATPLMLERIVAAQMQSLPDLTAVLDALCKNNGLTKVVRDQIAIGTEGENTVMGVVNGVSFAAHSANDDTNIDTRIKLEHLAGDLLMGDFFSVVNKSNAGDDSFDESDIDRESRFAFVQ